MTTVLAAAPRPLAGTVWTILLGLAATILSLQGLAGRPDPAVLFYSMLPRIVAALVAGFALGLSGAVFQRAFSNPLAEPGLLGISGGVMLALAASLIFAPALWTHGYQLVALGGAGLALAVVLAVAWGPRLSSPVLVLAGVMINLYCAAAYAVLVLFNHDFLVNLLAWQAGSLQQSGWAPSLRLIAEITAATVLLLLLERPLRLLSLGDGGAASLGLSVRRIKLMLLVAASVLAAVVTAEFGQIGFIGLAAPALARALWRQAQPGLLRAAITGALLLLFTDQFMRLLSLVAGDLPVGAAAGLLTGPLLIILARRNRSQSEAAPTPAPSLSPTRQARRPVLIVALALALIAVFLFGLFYGRGPEGFGFATAADLDIALKWRLPPLLGASGAGFCLALAGLILQRLLRNPLASPDVLGVSHGAGFAMALAFLILPDSGLGAKLVITTFGAGAALLLVAGFGRPLQFEPTRMLLIGTGLGSTANALLVLALASGGQRGAALLGWFSGITGGIDLASALAACTVGGLCLIATLFYARPIDLIALGNPAASSLGVPIGRTRLAGLGLAALATAAGTVVVGPMSFIGLMVPHFTLLLGFRKTAPAAIACGLIGALMMAASEWLGRVLAWPWPLSPGLIAALIGGPWFLWQLRRGAREF